MKLYRNAIILTVVLAILVGAYVLVKNKKGPENDTTTSDTSIKLLTLDTKKMTEITVEGSNGKFQFDNSGSEWKMTLPTDFKPDSSNISTIAATIADLTANKLISDNAADLGMYGLDKPEIITVKLKDNSTKVIEVGSETATKSGYYVKLGDSSKVYTVDSYTGEKLVVNKNSVRTTVLFDVKSEDVTDFSMDRGGANLFTAQKVDSNNWNILKPIQGGMDVSVLSPMIDTISKASVKEFVEDNAKDLSKYGLASPKYSFEFVAGSKKYSILLGNEQEKGASIYAKLADSGDVFTLDMSSLDFLDKPLKEIVDVFAYLANITDVNKVVVDMDGQTVTSEIKASGDDRDKDKFYVDGKDATMKDANGDQPFRLYYQALIGVTLDDIRPDDKPAGKPEITFTYYLKKAPGTMKIEFIPDGKGYYYIMRNGTYSGMVVAKSRFDEPDGVRQTYKAVMNLINKAK